MFGLESGYSANCGTMLRPAIRTQAFQRSGKGCAGPLEFAQELAAQGGRAREHGEQDQSKLVVAFLSGTGQKLLHFALRDGRFEDAVNVDETL